MELFQASTQWANRPEDERFTSLHDLAAHTANQRMLSSQAVISNRQLLAAPVEGDDTHRKLVMLDRRSDTPIAPSHWSFGQVAALIGAPASYLRTLPSPMAADCLNYGLQTRDVQEVGILTRAEDSRLPVLAAATGPNYGRVWNADIAGALVKRFGDGITGKFRVPGEFGERVEVTKQNTTLFAGDRDMFVFLADEENRISLPNRRGGQSGSLARGVFVYNSEVGSGTLGVAAFLFDYVCSNRIVWGAREFKEIKVRHTSGAPDRWLEQVAPAIARYAEGAGSQLEAGLQAAQAKKIGDKERVDAFLAARFTRSQVAAIKLAHQAEEQRPIETLWDAATGATAYARSIKWADQRVDVERKAGAILDLAL